VSVSTVIDEIQIGTEDEEVVKAEKQVINIDGKKGMVKQKSKEILIGTGNMTESLEKKEDSSEDEVVKAEKQVINIDGKKGMLKRKRKRLEKAGKVEKEMKDKDKKTKHNKKAKRRKKRSNKSEK